MVEEDALATAPLGQVPDLGEEIVGGGGTKVIVQKYTTRTDRLFICFPAFFCTSETFV
jgi:hypothetical protein